MENISKRVVFTICASNYLAQALTLKESVLKFNNVDFYIFLADDIKNVETEIENLIPLSNDWIKDWEEMAFKYNVIEFNTSIKPFCINKLFKEGYQKVIYLDPDIYVCDCFSYIWDVLDSFSVQLTPHYCKCVKEYNGAVDESVFMADGIYNLGFIAIRNDDVGNKIVEWWMNRLHSSCFSERQEALFVDQKWMDFIPGFFPEHVHISHHLGMNVAIWNLHERFLSIEKERYLIKGTDEKVYPLLFFHFSGFDPFDNEVINRRHPQYNIYTFPTFKPIIEEYRASVYRNGYDYYSTKGYRFNHFDNGQLIQALYRRLYRKYVESLNEDNISPFCENSNFYKLLMRNHLIDTRQSNGLISDSDKKRGKQKAIKYIHPLLRLFLRFFGLKKYNMLLGLSSMLSRKEYHYFLIEK